MAPVSFDQLAVDNHAVTQKPGLLQPRHAGLRAWRTGNRERQVPLRVTLPVTVLVSLALWAGIFATVRAFL